MMKGQNAALQKTKMQANSLSPAAGSGFEPPSCLELDKPEEHKLDPRRYQLEVLEEAKKANTIAYLDTGAGKTLIAVMLVKSYAHLLRKPKQNIAVFLVPKVVLVQQQAKVFDVHTDLKIGRFYGAMGVDFWSRAQWEEQLKKIEVFVMTPQIFLDNLRHGHFRFEMVKLIIFDECHNARKDHPYARIMKEFYHRYAQRNVSDLPRVFGMTASPINTKGSGTPEKCASEIKELEDILVSKVYALEDTSELETTLVYPNLKKLYYDVATTNDSGSLQSKLQEIKDKHTRYLETCPGKHSEDDLKKVQKLMRQCHLTVSDCLKDMGVWCAAKASEILLNNDEDKLANSAAHQKLVNTKKGLLGDFKNEFVNFLPSDNSWRCGAKLDQDKNCRYVSSKICCLVQALTTYRDRGQVRCIIFVERVMAARVLADFLGQLHCLSYLHFKYVAGVASGRNGQTRNQQDQIISEFHEGKVNVLVATSVLEEGLDVRGCNLVIRFDLPVTLRSYIQCRGRGRMPGSEYLILIKRGDELQKTRLERLIAGEAIMRENALNRDHVSAYSCRWKEEMYCVESTEAIVTLNSSLQLIYYYCSQLPKDRYYTPRPYFHMNKEDGTCILELPTNSPVKLVEAPVKLVEAHGNADLLKKLVCLKACKELHAVHALTDYLLPVEEEEDADEEVQNEIEECGTSYPLYIPSQLVGNWVSSGGITFYCYSISFEGDCRSSIGPRNVALLVGHALSLSVENMRVCLETDTGGVTTQARFAGKLTLNSRQVENARKFQVIIFNILKDRKFDNMLDLSGTVSVSCSHIMYLLLPLKICGIPQKLTENIIDWTCITNVVSHICTPSHLHKKSATYCNANRNMSGSLTTASGVLPVSLLQNSIVLTQHNKKLYCISHVSKVLNSRSPFPSPGGTGNEIYSYVHQFRDKHGIALKYKEQPLLCGRHLFGISNLLHKQMQKEKVSTRNTTVDLPAELCEVILHGISMDTIFVFSLLPSFMHHLEGMLTAAQLQKEFPNNLLSKSSTHTMKVLEALTRKSCQESFSLETLETLGDSFLKYIVSQQLFVTYPQHHEGQLTSKREKVISNHALYKLGCEHQILGYIRSEAFDPKKWIIPGQSHDALQIKSSNKVLFSTEKLYIREYRTMKTKVIADVVEALIGMHLETGGEPEAINFLKWLGIKIDFTQENFTYNRIHEVQEDFNINVPFLEKILKYKFHKPLFLVEALTHASYRDRCISSCYQRLEFLGDSVLDYVITNYLYKSHQGLSPGVLSDMRSAQVNNECYAQAAVKWDLQSQLQHASSMLQEQITEFVHSLNNGSFSKEGFFGWTATELNVPKVLGDLIESIAGAILVDSKFNAKTVWEKMRPLLEPIITPETVRYQPFRELQELCQKRDCKLVPAYTNKEGTSQCKIEVKLGNAQYSASGSAPNKKIAKKRAAAKVLKSINVQS